MSKGRIAELEQQLNQTYSKNSQFDKINQTNKDLVTKNCALKSQTQLKDKEISNLQERVRELESAVMKYEQNSENVAMMNQTNASKGSSQRAVGQGMAGSISSKNQMSQQASRKS